MTTKRIRQPIEESESEKPADPNIPALPIVRLRKARPDEIAALGIANGTSAEEIEARLASEGLCS